MKLWSRVVLFVGLGILAAYSGAQDASAYKVVVNASNPTAPVSRLKLGEMFLKKTPRWPDGALVMPVEPSGKSPVRQRFTLEIYGKQVIAISAYWQQMIFSGKGIPPPEKSAKTGSVKQLANMAQSRRSTPIAYLMTCSLI